MTNLTKKTCALYGCNNPVLNWRHSCCSSSHQKSYAAKKRHGTENRSNQTKEEFLDYVNSYTRAKQARMKNSMPKWANLDKIKLLYIEASRLTEETGVKHEVDHIIPLTNKLVCGLHVEHNLQIIPMSENRSKYNKFIDT